MPARTEKLTPGPWKADEPAMGFSALRAGKKLVFALANPSRKYGDEEMSEEEKRANLSLAEAAPDLYEVVSMTIQAMEMEVGEACAPEFGPRELLDRARAARDKARGEA